MKTEQTQLKRATELLARSLGGIEPAAALLDKGPSTVGRWTNRNDADYSAPLFAVREMEANAPEPLVTMALARLAGGMFIALPQAPGGDQALPLQIMGLMKEFGELSAEVGQGLADGDYSAADAARALDQLHDVERCSARLRMALEEIRDRSEATPIALRPAA